jgi:hypothetical protein
MEENIWRKCGSCKKPILLGGKYYLCGISSCKKSAYCSMPCFDDHTPIFRHKDAWAEERLAPKIKDADSPSLTSRLATAHIAHKASQQSEALPHDVLVVASKLKDYVRAKSGLNTSANVLDRLSEMIRVQCDKAIERAVSDNRKTLMDRDFYL